MEPLKPRTWEHTFLQGDDEAELRRLRNEAERLQPPVSRKSEPQLLAGDDAKAVYEAAAKAADAYAAEKRGVKVILRTLGRKKYRELRLAHPAREENDEDRKFGFNTDTFPEELVGPCLASPALSDADREEFFDSLTPAQFDLLAVAAYQLHEHLGADPKERLLSGTTES